jgi:Ca-activated chloride channel family protein
MFGLDGRTNAAGLGGGGEGLGGLFRRGSGPAPVAEPQRGPSEFTLRPGEELWVIERRTAPAEEPRSDDRPGSGCLMTMQPERPHADGQPSEGAVVPVPLRHTDVSARIDGYIGTVSVTQQFVNPFAEKIEAVYVFPLPENAAVNDFLMTIGDRTIRGVIREREEAEQIYSEARRQGYAASLLTQERPNIFTQRVANIEPGKEIDVEVRYFHTLAYRDGWFEWAFPMVVGPRFNPPCTTDGGGVGAVARGQFGASNQKTEVQYLRPFERSGHDISVKVSLDAGVPIESLECRTHQVSVQSDRATPNRAEVRLSSLDTIPNKDFVLRYRVAGRDVKSALMTQVTERGGFFSMLLVPPADLEYVQRGPVEMVFVVDCSGSMEGEPIAQAKRAVEHALRNLEPDDTFQVIDFAEKATQLGAEPLPATWDNVRRGIDFVQRMNAAGGTYMINGLRASLGFRHDPRRLRFVCFLTDGYIGNEEEILGELRKGLDDSRVFAMGVGSSVNRYLIEEMAKVGRGVAAVLTPGDDATDVMDKFLGRVSHASLCDLRIDWGGMEVEDVYPKRLPDLYVGRPVLVTGRYRGAGQTTVKVTGRIGGQKTPILIPANLDGRDGERGSIAAVWARSKLAELGTQQTTTHDESLTPKIRRVALENGLMSAYTSFIAVDSMTRTAGTMGTTVEQPVPVPEGVKYETTVKERSAARRWPGQDHP